MFIEVVLAYYPGWIAGDYAVRWKTSRHNRIRRHYAVTAQDQVSLVAHDSGTMTNPTALFNVDLPAFGKALLADGEGDVLIGVEMVNYEHRTGKGDVALNVDVVSNSNLAMSGNQTIIVDDQRWRFITIQI